MWERWNSYSHADGFGNAQMNSFNHYAYGAIGQWMYERIAGLAPDPEHPGYKHFFIQPAPGGPLESAQAELNTPYGLAKSGWEKKGKNFQIYAMVPPNSTATVIVPCDGGAEPVVTESGQKISLANKDGRWMFEVNPGTYQFVVEQ
jgi:alpha-L-rhamnosidase